jgi:hypothetical protein
MKHLSTSKRGCVVEYKAANLFLEAGFEVFMNMAPDGPADFIVWDGTTAYPIDTKKLQRFLKIDGTTSYNYGGATSIKNRHPNVYYLGWCQHDGFVWISQEVPEALLNVF